MRSLARGAALLAALSAAACEDEPQGPEARVRVSGTVQDFQANTRLFFYDEELAQLTLTSIQVRQDGAYGPLMFPEGTFFGAGTASGATTGRFEAFTIGPSDTDKTVNFDLDPITVPLVVGNRWTYDDAVFSPAPDTLRTVVEITGAQGGEGVPTVFTVEERTTDGGGTQTRTYFLAQDASGIRKSPDAAVTAEDELLLRLPATLGTSWSTIDAESGAATQKRISAFSCDEEGCVETNDFTIAIEPAGIFMAVSEIHASGDRIVVNTFSDIGIVDSFVQGPGGVLLSQRRLVEFTPGAAGTPPI